MCGRAVTHSVDVPAGRVGGDSVGPAAASVLAGLPHLRPGVLGDVVAGLRPECVAEPDNVAELAGLVADAHARGAAIVARGGGTKVDWGGPPARCDVLVETRRIAGVLDYVPEDLVVVVAAGTPLAALQAELAAHGQRLALDPPEPGATIGGVLATNAAGALRLGFGGARDLLLGVAFVRADGVVARAGSKVVKNVAGFDIGKLLVGSHGTLAILTEAALRVHPLPRATRYVCWPADDPDRVTRDTLAVLHSALAPVALEYRQARPDSPAVLCAVLEGGSSLAGRVGELGRCVAAELTVTEEPPGWWAEPVPPGQVVLEVGYPPAELASVLAVLAERSAARGIVLALRGSVGSGWLRASFDVPPGPEAVPGFVAEARTQIAAHGGWLTLRCAPGVHVPAGLYWGDLPGLGLMRRVKASFDPDSVFAPGRLFGAS